MIITLITKERLYTLPLPGRISGRYWVTDLDELGESRALIDVEAVHGSWELHSSPILVLLDPEGRQTDAITLERESQVISAVYRQSGDRVQLFIQPADEAGRSYSKYCIKGDCRLYIGRTTDNQIVFDNRYVSAHHACLTCEKGNWTITDTQSSNGTFVNHERVTLRELSAGDCVYIMGLKLVVGAGFFAINAPDGRVTVTQSAAITPLGIQAEEKVQPAAFADGEEHFAKSPRLYRVPQKQSLRVDAPPQRQKGNEIPAALMLGPAMTMGLTAAVMAAVSIYNLKSGRADLITTLPTLVMALAMLCSMLLWPVLTRRNEEKRAVRREELRKKRYLEYLDGVKNEIFHMGQEQTEILLENNPDAVQCMERVVSRDRRLWERSPGQEDFLQLRLGLGTLPLAGDIVFPDKRFEIEDDPLMKELRRLAEIPPQLKEVPITCSLLENPIIGLAGAAESRDALLRDMLVQLAVLHSYEDVRLVFLLSEAQLPAWKSARLLPHVWNEEGNSRFFAATASEQRTLLLEMERIAQERAENAQQHHNTVPMPHYVVVALDSGSPELKGLLQKVADEKLGISCLTVAERLMELPGECSMVVETDGEEPCVYDRKDPSGSRQNFELKPSGKETLEQTIDAMANLTLESQREKYTLPDMVTFLEMYGVGKVEHLNAAARWKENNPVTSLQAPLGVGRDGTPFQLDLHEKAHGPHGLIAGMTGSGKSELIITFILSMAVNYHPDEVSFILIDYKGGGLAGAFENASTGVRLPHLAGTITNLDGAAVNRALISIQSELRRRQAVFNQAREVSGEGTIDIYKYQKMYRSGLVSEPVPHLFIVSDEFAELKAQQPEFMSQLISTARIGRSLGVHLILATQKPSGVVNDQIWSNSRFRVCLKVQERADSMEMLKRPDAAELRETGRFYLQVGFNELFEQGQSAWCGAPYVPVDRIRQKRDDGVEVIDNLGRVLLETKCRETTSAVSAESQVVAVVRYLSQLAVEEKACARQLWLPQIPEDICLAELEEKYGWKPADGELEAVLGEYDDPRRQAQALLTIPFSREGSAVVYGMAGSGRTKLLNTVLAGLFRTYSARELNAYIADLGEENLQVFADAPQVGDVMLSSDGEKLNNLFRMLWHEIRDRKRIMAGMDGDFAQFCLDTNYSMPHILVVIRNYEAFSEQFEQLDEEMVRLTRECSKYGIYFLLTATGTTAIRYRLAQNLGLVYAMQLTDPADYMGLFGNTGGVFPSKLTGRGLFKTDKVYEFQTAGFEKVPTQQGLRALCGSLAEQTDLRARPVPVLPERVTVETFPAEFSPAAVPVGVEKTGMTPVSCELDQSVALLLMARDTGELSATVQGMCEQLARLEGSLTVLDGGTMLESVSELDYTYVRQGFSGSVDLLFEEMVHRNNSYKTALANKEEPEKYSEEYYVMTGLGAILDSLSAEGRDRLVTLLDKAESQYRIHFIICGTAKEMERFTMEPWYKKHLSGTEGIWVGDGISEQYILKVGKLTKLLYSELPEHFGYVVKRGRPVLSKLIVGLHCGDEEEPE